MLALAALSARVPLGAIVAIRTGAACKVAISSGTATGFDAGTASAAVLSTC
jgi:hypothetical protein